ncbi:hypothetical protein C8F04DRAFT_1142316 [Mycena alexandri]|uniref:Uncharacterized protein n=1 Tax=Mycena alexandri TaxID=1745969 RepID=A0AAD6S6X9_9AGAR|nr:hypothetical protein C8F04DRAFT_1142316 [Mycena alexandri]
MPNGFSGVFARDVFVVTPVCSWPQDDGDPSAAISVPTDGWRWSTMFRSLPMAYGADGPILRADSSAAVPSASSSGASLVAPLKIAFATGGPGSSFGDPRTANQAWRRLGNNADDAHDYGLRPPTLWNCKGLRVQRVSMECPQDLDCSELDWTANGRISTHVASTRSSCGSPGLHHAPLSNWIHRLAQQDIENTSPVDSNSNTSTSCASGSQHT